MTRIPYLDTVELKTKDEKYRNTGVGSHIPGDLYMQLK
jgi:hypothetical protein